MLQALLNAWSRCLSATEALADLLDVPHWDGEEPIPTWCERTDTLVNSPWSRARRTMVADLVSWEHDPNVSPTMMALTAITRSTRRDGSDDGIAGAPSWSSAAHAIGPDGRPGLGSHRAVAHALQTWVASESWRDDATPAELGIPVQIGSQFRQRPQVVTYRPIGEDGEPMVGTFEPCPDDYVREAVSETRCARVTPAWNRAKVLVREHATYVRSGDGSYTVVTTGEVKRYRSRAEYLNGRARKRASIVTGRLSALRAEQRALRDTWAETCAALITAARDSRVIGPVTYRDQVVATIKPGTRSAHVYSADGRRLPATRDITQHARALATSLA